MKKYIYKRTQGFETHHRRYYSENLLVHVVL